MLWYIATAAAFILVGIVGVVYFDDIRAKLQSLESPAAASPTDNSVQTATAEVTAGNTPAEATVPAKAAAVPRATLVPQIDEADLANQAAQWKAVALKIRSAGGFIHDGGEAAYNKALADMNNAQVDYYNHARSGVGRDAALGRAQTMIDIALVHGLETYDYLIQKKFQQLELANSMDITGITPAESSKIRTYLDEGRWLTYPNVVVWWVRGSGMPRDIDFWQEPTIDSTKKGLWVHDRAEEIVGGQESADSKFSHK